MYKKLLALLLLCLQVLLAPSVEARLVFSNEESTWDGNQFIIDVNDEVSTDIDLKFGASATGRIRFDVANDNFKINKNVDFEGNNLINAEIENLAVAPTCDGASIGRIYFNTTDANAYICNGTTFDALGSGSTTTQFPAVQARRTTAYTLTTTFTDITLDTTDIENAPLVMDHDNTLTDRVNINQTGLYQVIYSFTPGGTATSTHEAFGRVQLNDTTVLNGSLARNKNYQGEYSTTSSTFITPLTAGDFLSLQLSRDAVADTTIGDIFFSVVKIEGIKGEKGDQGDPGTSGSSTVLEDTDQNTLIQVEETANEDRIRFDTAGTERMIIGNTGNVGIGTSDPQRALHVAGSNGVVRVSRPADTSSFIFDRYSGADTESTLASAFFGLNSPSAGNGEFFIANYNEAVTGGGYTRWLTFDIASDQASLNLYGSGTYDSSSATRLLGVEADGSVVEVENASATKYQFIDIFGCVRGSANAGTVGGGNSPVIRFDAGTESQLRCSFPVPDDWQAGTDIVIETYWSPSDNTAGAIDFDLEYASFGVGETISGGSFTDAIPGATFEPVTISTQLNLYELAVNIPAAALALDDMVNFELARTPADAGDTYNADINVHMLRISYTGKKLQ